MEEDVLHSTLSVLPCQDIPTRSWRRASVTRSPGDVNGTPRRVLEDTSVKDRPDDTDK